MKQKVSTLGFSLFFSLSISITAPAEDWPQFRGPNRDGVWSDLGLSKTFPLDGLKMRWRQPVSWGCSSPVVAQGRVFVSDAQFDAESVRERIHCFDETSGQRLWSYSYAVVYPDWAFVPGQKSGPCSTPVVDSGKVHVMGANGHLHCLDARTGALLWARDLRKDYEIRDLMCRGSPLIDGNLLIVTTGAKPGACVLALDKETGQEIWKALDEPVSNSSPIIIKAGGKRQLIFWSDASVASLDPVTGVTYWREPMVTSNNDSIPTPVVSNTRLLISGLMMELNATTPAAAVLWPESRAAAKRLLSNTSTPVLLDDYLFSAKSSGELVCLQAATGAPVWETNTVTDLRSGASIHITLTGDTALLFTDRGDLIRAELSPGGYRELGRAHLIDPTLPFGSRNCAWTPPAYANQCVFARNDKELVCASLAEPP